MKRMPSKYFSDDLKDQISNTMCGIMDDDGTEVWVAARPLPYYHSLFKSIAKRIRLAKDVFTGKADALYWYRQ